MEVNFPTFVETYPRKGLRGGGINIVSADRSINFLTTFMEDERAQVEGVAKEVLAFLNAKS